MFKDRNSWNSDNDLFYGKEVTILWKRSNKRRD